MVTRRDYTAEGIEEEGYKKIEELLRHRGYRQGEQPFIFFRTVKMGDRDINVEVNLLAGEYEGSSKSHRHQKIQGIRARKVRECDLVFEMPKEIKIEGITDPEEQARIQRDAYERVNALLKKLGIRVEG